MMVFFKERLTYLAVPKTGTSAVERALHHKASMILRDPPGLKHTNARGYERRFRELFDRKGLPQMETVAVMREPLSWLGSWYRYRQRPALNGHPNSTAHLSFDDFMEGYLSDDQPDFAKVGAQGQFVSDGSGQLLINHLFRYEDLDPFLFFMERKLGAQIRLKAVNTSPKGQTPLSEGLYNAFRQRNTLDFEIYEALKDGPLSLG